MKKPKLTPKQKRFVEEYLIDFNATRAAKAAGYSEKTARSLATDVLANPCVQAIIKEKMQKLSERAELTVDYVIDNLREIVRRSMNPPEGQRPNFPAANKALELLGRHRGMFTDRVEIRQQGPPPTVIIIRAGKEAPAEITIKPEALPERAPRPEGELVP